MCQLTSWAKVKEIGSWYSRRVAIKDQENNLVGVTQLLFRKIPIINKTMCYIPRGYVCDYDNTLLLEAITNEVVKVAKEENAMVITIDPLVKRAEHPNLQNELIDLGFKHNGFNIGMDDIQPRFVMVTDISGDIDDVFKAFGQTTRSDIRRSNRYNLALELGDLSDVDEFSRLMEITGERSGFNTRGKAYFEKLLKEYQKEDDAHLALAKMYPKDTTAVLQKEIDQILDEKSRLEKRLETTTGAKRVRSLENQLKDLAIRETNTQKIIDEIKPLLADNEPIILAASIITFSGDKAYYLYAAASNEFRNFYPNYFMIWELMKLSKERGCKTFDFGGVSGSMEIDDEHYGLFDFKKQFDTEMIERVGEFDYILKPGFNYMFNKMLDFRQFLLKLRSK